MGLGKTYSTRYLADSNNNTGAAGQVLISTATGIDWSDGSDIIGGPYLPLSAGVNFPLTGGLYGISAFFSSYIKFGGYSYIGEDLTETDSLTIASDNTESIFFAHHYPATSTYTTTMEISPSGELKMPMAADGDKLTVQSSLTPFNNIIEIGQTGSDGYLDVSAANGNIVTHLSGYTGYASYFLSNVGIGTTNPGTLHGVSYGTTRLQIDGGTDRGQLIIEGDSFAGIVLSDNGATANQRVFATSVDDTKYTIKPLNDNGTSTAGGVAVTVLHGGNVGIGTTAPNNLLNLQKNVADGDVAIYIQNNNSVVGSTDETASVKFAHGNDNVIGYEAAKIVGGKEGDFESSIPNIKGNLQFYTAGGTSLTPSVNNVERMRITSSGNVGIGTTSPDSLLEISKAQASGPILKITEPTTINGTTEGGPGNNLGVLGFVSADTSTSQANLIRASVEGQPGEKPYGTGGLLTFNTMQTYQGSGTLTDLIERMRIDSAGAIKFNAYDSTNNTGTPTYLLGTDASGNVVKTLSSSAPGSLWAASGNDIYNTNSADVGIGITNPSGKFHVYNAAAHNNIYFNGGDIGGTGYDVNLYLNGGANNSEMSINMGIVGNEDRDRIKTYQGNMYFRTNDSERVIINSSGNVGIGTTLPASKLEVSGRISGGELGNPKITRQGLTFYVDFNDKACISGESSTEKPIDLGPNSYDLTLLDGANFEYLNGIGTFYFDGSADRIQVNDFVVADTTNSYEIWHYANTQNTYETWWDSGNERPLLGTYNDQLIAYPAYNGSTLGITITPGKWYHVVWAFNGNNDLDIFVNGVRRHNALGGTIAQRTGTFDAWLGGDTSLETTNGYIAIARTYSRQLTPDDVLQNYNAEVNMFAGVTPSLGIVQSGGNVGIGTASPSTALHIDQRSNDRAGGLYIERNGSSYGLSAFVNSGGYGVIGSNGSFTTDILTMDLNNGNVGIGTTSPGNKLTIASGTGGGSAPDSRTLLHIDKDGEAYISINSPAESFNGIRLNVAGSPKAFMELYDNTAQGKKLNIGTTDARDLVFDTGNQPKMTILSGGNVGIGYTSPTNYRLEVNGNVKGDSFGTDQSTTARIFSPSGAAYNGSGAQTGYLIMQLPDNGAGGVNNMMSGVIRVFDYNYGESFDVRFSGYWYSGYNWTNCTAYVINEPGVERNFPVRFGAFTGSAGANTRPYIAIGETTSTWTYCKFSVTEYTSGHSNAALYKWNSGWAASLSATLPGAALVTVSNTQTNNWKRSGYNLYYSNGGNVGIGTTAFAPTTNKQLKLGNMGSGVVGEIFDAVDNADNSRIIICGGGTGTPQFSMRHYSASYGLDIWMNTSSPWDTYFDVRQQTSGFRWRNYTSNDGGEVDLMTLSGLAASIGTLTVKGDIVAYGSPSDKRLKENIKPIESALDKVSKLQGVTFDWKESDSILDIKEDIGFIAQDVQKVIPELVRESEGGMLSMRHQGIAPILLEAIKELKAEIDLLKSKPCTCNKCNCNI